MNRKTQPQPFDYRYDGKILHDNGIGSDCSKVNQIVLKRLQFLWTDQVVYRYINLLAHAVGDVDGFLYLLS
ncbi:hypothetical protein D3C78_1880710 [compost metagenome]